MLQAKRAITHTLSVLTVRYIPFQLAGGATQREPCADAIYQGTFTGSMRQSRLLLIKLEADVSQNDIRVTDQADLYITD